MDTPIPPHATGGTPAQPTVGAYGLALSGVHDPRWMERPPHGWEPWRIIVEAGSRPMGFQESVGPDCAELRLEPSGVARIDRERGETAFVLPSATLGPGLPHPYLGATAVVVAWWRGSLSFHAGSFVVDGGVWGILGDRGEGKSSTLAWMASVDMPVFSDDVVVLSGDRVFAGPRCLDLREGAVRHFGVGEDIGVVGTRRRWRVSLPAVPQELPFRGWVALRWAEHVSLRRAGPAERLGLLTASRGMKAPDSAAVAWLDALAKPMLVLERPKDWAHLEPAMHRLVAGASGA